MFSEVWTLVRDNFVDPELRGLDWEGVRRRYAPRAARAATVSERAAVINEMLAELRTSHTHYYTRLDPQYYQLLGIFQERFGAELVRWFPEGLRYPSAGLLTESIEGGTFVRGVLDESSAQRAGVRVGDRIVSADGAPFEPVRSFDVGPRPVQLEIQRSPDPASVSTIPVLPVSIEPRQEFLIALLGSMRVIEKNNRRIGYVHVWSWAGLEYQQALEHVLASPQMAGTEGLVLDVREGWGGADTDYLHMFDCGVPRVTTIDRRQGKTFENLRCWDRPVVLLINEKTRSGKELVAYGFKKSGRGKLVGARTAGAVTSSRQFVLSDGSLLFLAAFDVLVDGERLEGVGVAPDIEVPFDFRYAGGADPQLDRAVDVLIEQLGPTPTP